MIRFILRHENCCAHTDMRTSNLFTVDIDVPELEALVNRGGHGPSGFDYTHLVGIEVLPTRSTP